MWRFINGVSRPQDKRKADRKDYYGEYDSKRSRSFSPKWCENRPWLKNTTDGMVCLYCKKHDQQSKSNFISGCVSYKLDAITKHEECKGHIKSRCIEERKPIEKSEAANILVSLNKNNSDKLHKMFRTCHALVMHDRPIADFVWLCDLDEKKGVDLGSTYRTRDSAAEFIHCIADAEFQKVTSAIAMSDFVCVISDGSTDCSVKEQEMYFIRTCLGGVIKVPFAGVYAAERGNAENIIKGLETVVQNNINLPWGDVLKKLVAVSCDGASVNTGKKSGVGALLRNRQGCVITLHCMAHRLELALKDALKKVPLYQKTVGVLLKGLYYFYHKSALNNSMLRRTFTGLKTDVDKLKIPTRCDGTRWVAHQLLAATNVLTSYKFIVTHMEQWKRTDSKAKAKGFLNLLKSRDTVSFLLMMVDLLTPLKQLSLILQEETAVLAKQHRIIESTLEAVKKLKSSDGPYLRKLQDTDSMYKGVQLSKGRIFQHAKTSTLDAVIDAISRRFSDFCDDRGVVSATRIADLKAWPLTWEHLKDFGDQELQVLLDHFKAPLVSAGITVEEAEIEWTPLKKILLECDLKSGDTNWESVNRKHGSQFPNVLKVMDLILSISPSSAQAERGFSQLKLCKSNLRNRLGQNLLNDVLGIKHLSDTVQKFDPENAVKLFQVKALRRPGPRKTTAVNPERETIAREIESVQREGESVQREGESVQEEESVQRDEESVDIDAVKITERETPMVCESESEDEMDENGEESESEETVFEKLLEIETERV